MFGSLSHHSGPKERRERGFEGKRKRKKVEREVGREERRKEGKEGKWEGGGVGKWERRRDKKREREREEKREKQGRRKGGKEERQVRHLRDMDVESSEIIILNIYTNIPPAGKVFDFIEVYGFCIDFGDERI